MITVTDSAVKQLQNILGEQAGGAARGLRLFVETGGCCGMQYGMALDQPKEGDEVVDCSGVQVMIDAFSVQHLRGSTIDFADTPDGAGFRILNPNASDGCGCGHEHGDGHGDGEHRA
jgi:iron-sulfur cluster assembly accessory protein